MTLTCSCFILWQLELGYRISVDILLESCNSLYWLRYTFLAVPWEICEFIMAYVVLTALLMVGSSHLHFNEKINEIECGCEAISGWNYKIAQNCLTCMLNYIVMQMRKVNCRKGYFMYSLHLAIRVQRKERQNTVRIHLWNSMLAGWWASRSIHHQEGLCNSTAWDINSSIVEPPVVWHPRVQFY